MVEKGLQTMTDTLTTASRQDGLASTEGQLNTKKWGEASVSSLPTLTRPHKLSE
jgi:hypothetical protein